MGAKFHRHDPNAHARPGWVLLGLLLLTLTIPATAAAQPPRPTPSDTENNKTASDLIRYQEAFRSSQRDSNKTQADTNRLQLTLIARPIEADTDTAQKKRAPKANASQTNKIWDILLSPAPKSTPGLIIPAQDDVIFQDTFPDWATQAHYGYELRDTTLASGEYVLLLTALPGINANAAPDSSQFQIAWIHKNRVWKRIGTAKYSMLDGGSKFKFSEVDGSTRLIRQRPNTSSNFCGTSTVQSPNPPVFEVFKPQSSAFINRVDIDALLKDAKPLQGTPADNTFNPPYLRTWSQWFAASSDRRGDDRQGARIRPLELGDRRFDTAWMEGGEGLGRGEFVSSQINDAIGLSSVRIVPGLGTDEGTLSAFAHPTKVLIALSDGSRFVVNLASVGFDSVQKGRGVLIELPSAIRTNCLSVMLLESAPGKATKGQPNWAPQTVAISQITPYSSLHFGNAEQTARQIVERIADEPDSRTRTRIAQMALSLKTPLANEVRRAAENASPVKRKRILALIGSLPSEQAAKLLTDFIRQTEPGSAEYRTIKRGLASLQQHAAGGLIEYLRENSIKSARKRVDLLRLIGRVAAPDELIQLIAELGHGTGAERNERIRAIAAGERAMLEPLLVHASEHPGLAEGYDAIQTLNLIGHRLHYHGQGELPRPELYKKILDHAEKRRMQLRVLEVAKYFQVDGFLDLIDPAYTTHTDPMVRAMTIKALSQNASPQARALIVAALKDTSPDVRIAAIDALSQRSDLHNDLEAIIEYSRAERWKLGLQRAFKILAKSDAPAAAQRFVSIFGDQPNTEKALIAARALRRAEGHLDANLSEAIIRDKTVQSALRLEMLKLLGLDSSQAGEDFLIGVFRNEDWKNLFDDPKEQGIARQRVFMTLGRRRNPQARTEMLALAAQAISPEVQYISLRALAFYKDQALLDALEKQRETAVPKTQGFIDQTIAMIKRRRALDSVKEGIEKIDDDKDTNDEDRGDKVDPK